MPNNYYPSQTFNSPLLSRWDALEGDLRERLAHLEPGRLIELGFSVKLAEVAWVTIYRAADGTTTASGPHGPYPASDRTEWTWHPDADQPRQAALIARTIIEYLQTLDAVPRDSEPSSFGGLMRLRVTTPESAFINRDPQWDDYTEHRTGAQIARLLHYGHIIPISRGFTEEHVNENYPGWTWNELSSIMQSAGVVINRGGAPATCELTMKAIHFTDAEHWAVEWLSGEVTRPAPRLGPEPR